MGIDPVAALGSDPAHDPAETRVVHVGGAPASAADQVVVVVGRLAGDVGMITGRQVDPLDGPDRRESVDRAEDRRAPDVEAPRRGIVHQVGRREVPASSGDDVGHGPTRPGQAIAGAAEGGDRGFECLGHVAEAYFRREND